MTKKNGLKALIIALCVALTMGIMPGCSKDSGQNEPEQETAQAETTTQAGKIVLALTAEDWESSNQGVPVNVSGTSSDGEKVERIITIVPGQAKNLDLSAGSYDFSVDGSKISTDTIAYQSTTVHVDFGGSQDLPVNLDVRQDAEATQELARKAEEEAAAKAQAEAEAAAEAQRQAEAEAAAQAEAQRQAEAAAQAEAQRQAEAAAAAAQNNEQTVYITNTGEKYHRNGCRYLKKSQIPISLSDAQARGYTACKKCF